MTQMESTKKCVTVVYPVVHLILITINVFLNMIMLLENEYFILLFTVPNILIDCNLICIQLYTLITGKRNKNIYLTGFIISILYHITNILCIVILYRLELIKNMFDIRVFAIFYIMLHTVSIMVSTSDMIIYHHYKIAEYDNSNDIVLPVGITATSA